MSGRTGIRSCPERTCVGCRSRATKADLLRVVVVEGVCIPDPPGRLPGRGAYVHPTAGCLDLAERRRAFPRALRRTGPLDTSVLRRYVETQVTYGERSRPAVPEGYPSNRKQVEKR
ncbi:MAG: YlxR family protein [Streptomycetales bacterium]